MDAYTRIFDLLLVISGAYMIFWGISGKGNLYQTENIKAKYAELYKKLIRVFCLAGGFLAVLMGVLEHFKIEPIATIAFYSLCGVVMIAFFVVLGFTDKDKEKNYH